LQIVLGIGLIAAVVWSCKPATAEPDAASHNAARCEVCQHPNSQVGAGDGAHDLIRGAERHLHLCATCRGAGLTVADLLAGPTPTPCMAQPDPIQATHSDSVTR
jgi:hypothetical protein